MSKKILLVGNHLPGLIGFRGELVQQLITRGHQVSVLVPKPDDLSFLSHPMVAGANLLFMPMEPRGKKITAEIDTLKSISRAIKKTQPEVILTYTIKPNFYVNFITRGKIPVIMNITGMGSNLHSSKFKAIYFKLYKLACNYSYKVMFQNENSLKVFLDNELVDLAKTERIPGSGVNLDKFTPTPMPELPPMKFLFIGRLMIDKGIREFLEAAKAILDKHHNVTFDVVGDEVEPLDFIKHYRGVEGIHFYPHSNDVKSLYQNHHVIVNPSYHEGMSNILLEAATSGRSLLASNIPGCKEIVDEGVNGHLFEPKSSESLVKAIELVLQKTKAQLEEMGENSRKIVEERFDRQIIIDKYIELIDQFS